MCIPNFLPSVLRCLVVFAASSLAVDNVPAAEPSPVYLDALADQITSTFGELGINASCDDRATKLRIKDKQYQRGLAHHASDDSSLFVPLDGQYKTFEAEIGIQWQGGKSYPIVDFLVYVDDKLVFESGIVRENDPPRKISIPVEGADMLRLVATVAGNGGDGSGRLGRGTAYSRPRTQNPACWHARRHRPVRSRRDLGPETHGGHGRLAQSRSFRRKTSPGNRLEAGGRRQLRRARHGRRFGLHRSAVARNPVPAPSGIALVANTTAIPPADAVQLQYWGRVSYASPWQGQWKPLPAKFRQSRSRLELANCRQGLSRGHGSRSMGFRGLKEPIDRQIVSAYSRSSWTTADLRAELQQPTAGKQAQVVVYNGDLLESSGQGVARSLPVGPFASRPTLKVRYSKPRAEKDDRTVLRFELPETNRSAWRWKTSWLMAACMFRAPGCL